MVFWEGVSRADMSRVFRKRGGDHRGEGLDRFVRLHIGSRRDGVLSLELDASLAWLALTLTPGLAARLCGRLLRRVGSPQGNFCAPPSPLGNCNFPPAVGGRESTPLESTHSP